MLMEAGRSWRPAAFWTSFRSGIQKTRSSSRRPCRPSLDRTRRACRPTRTSSPAAVRSADQVHEYSERKERHGMETNRRQEELGAVRVCSGVRHGQDSRSRVLQVEVLVGELLACSQESGAMACMSRHDRLTIDGLSAGAVAASKVASLDHEVGNDAMEHASLEPESCRIVESGCVNVVNVSGLLTLLAGAQGAEIFGRFGDDVTPQLHGDPAERLVVSRHVEEDSR